MKEIEVKIKYDEKKWDKEEVLKVIEVGSSIKCEEINKPVVVAASGFFDPLHAGHCNYLRKAKTLGDKLIVIVNNAEQAIVKKNFEFMPFKERFEIIKSLSFVDIAFKSIDTDETVCKSLEALKPTIFAKGGDRKAGEIPETKICEKLGIKIVDGLGEKIQSSSDLIENVKRIKPERMDHMVKGADFGKPRTLQGYQPTKKELKNPPQGRSGL